MKAKFLLLFTLAIFLSINAQDKKEMKNESLKNAKKIIMLKSDFTIKVGEVAYYSGSVHSSVGSTFNIDYNADYFKEVESDFEYKNPENANTNGGDAGVKTYYYKALKAGEFEFTVNNRFRGETQSTDTIKIIITE